MLSANAKLKVQSFGRFLSNMVMPNIGAFIAWGFITALFIQRAGCRMKPWRNSLGR